MNIELSVYYSIQDEVQEPVSVQIDDEALQYLLTRYLNTNFPDAQLEDWIISGVCLD